MSEEWTALRCPESGCGYERTTAARVEWNAKELCPRCRNAKNLVTHLHVVPLGKTRSVESGGDPIPPKPVADHRQGQHWEMLREAAQSVEGDDSLPPKPAEDKR